MFLIQARPEKNVKMPSLLFHERWKFTFFSPSFVKQKTWPFSRFVFIREIEDLAFFKFFFFICETGDGLFHVVFHS